MTSSIGERIPLHRSAAVIGIGQTDWRGDWNRVRQGEVPFDSYGYATIAFKNAMQDAQISIGDIDGLISGHTTSYERMGEVLGLNVRWGGLGHTALAISQAVMAIETGMAEVVALVYGNNQRSGNIQYGGPKAMGGENSLSYVYHSPWGLTSQGSLYAMMQRRYAQERGYTESDMGQVAVAQRAWAALNPNAVMQKSITLEDYLASDYVCEPLHLFDYCMINDGGVAMILAESNRARVICENPIYIETIARFDYNQNSSSLRPQLENFYSFAQAEVADKIFNSTGWGPEDMDLVQIYDSFAIHVPVALEGYGYCKPGDFPKLCREKGIGPGGKIPVNTSGGHLSESYMQGWNHQLEIVRQLRGTCAARQVDNCQLAHYSSDIAGKAFSIIYGI